MFNSLKNVFGLGKNKPAAESVLPSSMMPPVSQMPKVSQWAAQQGFNYSERPAGRGVMMEGTISGKPWRLELGSPSRDFIVGHELRARGEMGVRDDAAVMVMTRSLKSELDKRAFSMVTDDLQTQMRPDLPEEMRWLSMYEEVGWESLGAPFLDRYAILADKREHAMAWINPELVQPLLAWPSSEPGVPQVLMILRGKVYLRMQINPNDIPMLEHATRVFTLACDCALAGF